MKFSGATHIGVCMDRSGSMQHLTDDTIGGFNSWLTETRKAGEGKDVRLTLQLFDNEHLWPYSDAPLETVRKLNRQTYVPRGSTALLDAIGQTIGRLEENAKKQDRVLVVIITDGQENASVEFSSAALEQLIARCEKRKNWSFVYLGANQDAFAVSRGLGFRRAAAVSTDRSGVGTRAVYNTVSGMSGQMMASNSAQAPELTQDMYETELEKEKAKGKS